MKQERLKRSYEWSDRLIKQLERKKSHMLQYQAKYTEGALQIYRPLRYAAAKAIEKPPRMVGNRAFCPDCGGSVRTKDNYCRRCGQRLVARQQDGESRFMQYSTRNTITGDRSEQRKDCKKWEK